MAQLKREQASVQIWDQLLQQGTAQPSRPRERERISCSRELLKQVTALQAAVDPEVREANEDLAKSEG